MSWHERGRDGEADARFRTLELRATLSVDSVALRGIMEREVEAQRRRFGPRSAVIVSFSRGEGADESDDPWSRQGLHIWWVPPTHWREEIISAGYPPIVIVVRPDVSLSWIPTLRTLYTSEPPPPVTGLADRLRRLVGRMRERKGPFDDMTLATIAERVAEWPLTNPRLPAAEWELTTLGQEKYLGRAVRRVHARRRPDAAPVEGEWRRRSGYWSWAEVDEYECLVDDALQILLHLTGKADGVPIGIVSVDEVRVDAPIPADIFAFVPPAGTRIVHRVDPPRPGD